jgi:hypothetical protein
MTTTLRHAKELKINRCVTFKKMNPEPAITRTANSRFAKGGISCPKDSFVVNQTLVFQIKFCGKSPALRVAENLYGQV